MEANLLPADIYQVVNKSILNEYDKSILTLLYMPIIGSTAVSLYLTLYNELKTGGFISNELTHHHLMTCMALNLKDIKNARIKLEGIALMKTYYMEGSINSYVYELYSPLTAREFFEHPIFNVVLFNNVGKEEYNHLLSYFKVPTISLKNYKDITTPLDMSFKSKNYTNFEMENNNIVGKDTLKLSYEMDYDFDLLSSSLPKDMFKSNSLNKSTKELIVDLSFLYELDPVTMAEIIRVSINEKCAIDKELLRRNVRKYYQYNNSNRLPSLIFKSQVEYLKSPVGDNSNRGRIIKVFESTSPYEFLKAKYKGAKPLPRDMKILELLLVDLKLNPAVVNVLIDYCLKANNNKLVGAYVETIAGQWKRSNIETAVEAMELAEKEHKKYYKNTNISTKREEKTPTWFNENLEKDVISEEDKKELEDLLKEYKK
ncbi:MAG: DnaD domain protein [Bacilli bacterium]